MGLRNFIAVEIVTVVERRIFVLLGSRSEQRRMGWWILHRFIFLLVLIRCLVLVVILITKFEYGAWIAVLAMAILFAVMRSIKKHYDSVAAELAIDDVVRLRALPSRVHAVILVSNLRKPVLRALAFARASRPSRLDAVTVDVDPEQTRRTLADWEKYEIPVPITVLASPYRDTVAPLVRHVREHRRRSPRDLTMVFIPEYVVRPGWRTLLHNRTATRQTRRLQREPGVMVGSVPWQVHEGQGS